MAMTKAEKKQLEDAARLVEIAQTETRITKALRWTEPKQKPDLLPPSGYGAINKLINGWSYNTHSRSVAKACSSSISHHYGGWDKTTTQNPKSLYSTKLLALKALRAELEREFAVALCNIDNQIKEEQGKE